METQPLLRLWHCCLLPSSLKIAVKVLVLCTWAAPPNQNHSSYILGVQVSAIHPGSSWSEGTFPYWQRSHLEPHFVGELWLQPHRCKAGQSDPLLESQSQCKVSHHQFTPFNPKQLSRGNNSPPLSPWLCLNPWLGGGRGVSYSSPLQHPSSGGCVSKLMEHWVNTADEKLH